MIRLILLGALGYMAYRVGREFVGSVPNGFEPTPVQTTRKRRTAPSRQRRR